MHLTTRNVNSAFRELVQLFAGKKKIATIHGARCDTPNIIKRPSRNGNVLMIDEPVTITYTHPRERVLFNQARDANPFFHLYESLWMLAGRNDVESVAYYAKQMREYSDDGETLNGAYGYRWRGQYLTIETEIPPSKEFPYGCRESEAKRIDQLDILADHLKVQPESRRAVLQMWNVEDDLLKIGQPETGVCTTCFGSRLDSPCPTCNGKGEVTKVRGGSKDVCCNLSVMFSVRTTVDRATHGYEAEYKYLDMTVTNRSNDLIWGLLGANFCHFTILQEYMAARLGAEVGVYHHFTNNLHAYDWNWRPEEWLSADMSRGLYEPYCNWDSVPLMKDPTTFDEDLGRFVEWYSRPRFDPRTWREPFLDTVARSMFEAFAFHKRGKTDLALDLIETVAADDWRLAGKGWLERRNKG